MTDLEIAAYVDHGLDARRRDALEDHLAQCRECRENVLRTQDIVDRSLLSRRSRRLAGIAALLLAAATIAIVAVPSLRSRALDNRDAQRAEEVTPSLIAYGPLGEVNRAPSRFTWGSLHGAISYRITLTTQTGVTVWSTSTPDTTVVLPTNISLNRGRKYLWVVDVITSDGTTRSSGLREFGIIP